MSAGVLEILVLLAILSPLFFHLPGVRTRQIAFAACNVLIIGLLLPNTASWAALGVFLLSGYGVARLLQVWPRTWFLLLYVFALVLAFAIIKRYVILDFLLPAAWLSHPLAIVGISYMLFRQIHFIVDSKQQQIARPSLWAYVNYQLNFFALVAGPIQRYPEFEQWWRGLEPLPYERNEALKLCLRILVGIIKAGGVSLLFLTQYQALEAHYAVISTGAGNKAEVVGTFIAMFYLYPAYVYVNFAGYCDIVIASAALFTGQRLPENFDQPYLARNLIDFWTRWHRTLGFWIRDYIFLPTYMPLARRFPRSANYAAAMAYFVGLLLGGIWHGSTLNFVIFGLLHGVGVLTVKLWENYLTRTRGRAGLKEYNQSPKIRLVAILVTFHYFCITMLFFPDDLGVAWDRIQHFFIALLR